MRRPPASASRPWLTWALTAAGMLLVDFALMRYTSYADRRILSRWSPVHFTLIVLVSLAFALTLYRSLRARAGRSPASPPQALGIPVWSLERAFDGHAYSSLIVNHLDHHPNELAARVIVDRFRAEFDRSEPASR